MPPVPRTAKFIRTPQGVQSYVEKAGQGLVAHKLYATPDEASSAIASAQAAGWNVLQDIPQPPPPPLTQINSVTRTPQGLNTGATTDLNNIPFGSVQSYKVSPEDLPRYTQSSVIDTSYNPTRIANQAILTDVQGRNRGIVTNLDLNNIGLGVLQPDRNRYNYTALPFEGDRNAAPGYWVSDQEKAYNNFINAKRTDFSRNYDNKKREFYQTKGFVPTERALTPEEELLPEIGKPEILTYWGKINNREAPYTQADLNNPRRGAPPSTPNQYIGIEDSLDDLEKLQQRGINFYGTGDPSGGKALVNYDLLLKNREYAPNDFITGLGERKQFITDQYNALSHYRQELGEEIPKRIISPKQFIISKDNPKYTGVVNYAKQEGYFDNYPHYNPPATPTNIILSTIGGEAPRGIRAFAPESDSYSMVPQSAIGIEPTRNLLRFPTYPEAERLPLNELAYPDQLRSVQQNQNKSWYDQDPNYRNQQALRGMPTLPLSDPRVKEAQLNDNAARLDYQAEQQKQINKRSGSFNIVVDNDGHRNRVIEEGLYSGVPDDPANDIISGLKSNGKPYQIQVNAGGQIKGLELPNNIEVEIPGMGYFPLTGGATTDIHLGNQIAEDNLFDGAATMKEGQDLYLKDVPRDHSNRFMMDGFDALNAKRRATQRAVAQYEVAKRKIEWSGIPYKYPELSKELEQLEFNAKLHTNQLAQAERNYAQAMRLEPQTSKQKVTVTVNSPTADDAIALLQSRGLKNVASTQADNGYQISGSGEISLNDQMQLHSQLQQQFNPEQVLLPPGVSIANTSAAFKKADIPDKAFVQGVEWGKDAKGNAVIVNPGKPTGEIWQGQPIVVSNSVTQPTVTQVAPTREVVNQPDPELQQLIAARDNAKKQRAVKLVELVNARRANRGEALLGIGPSGGLYRTEYPDSIFTMSPDDISNTVFSAAVRKQEPFSDETAAVLNQGLHNAAVRNSREKINLATANSPETYSQSVGNFGPLQPYIDNAMQTPKKVTRLPRGRAKLAPEHSYINGRRLGEKEILTSDDLSLLSQDVHPLDRVNTSVVRPATVNLDGLDDGFSDYSNWHPTVPVEVEQSVGLPSRPADLRWIQSVADTSSGEIPPDLIQMARARMVNATPPFRRADLSWVQPPTHNPFDDSPPDVIQMARARMPIQNAASPRPTEIPIDWQQEEQVYRNRARQNTPPTSAPERVQIVEEPRTNYIPAAVALGALGLGGAGIGYAMTRPREDDEEMQRQQLMQQYVMQQQMQGRYR